MTRRTASGLLLVAACAAGCSQQSRSPVAPEPPQFPSTIRITGAVLDGEDRPVAGARLLPEGGPAQLEGLSDVAGRYEFTVPASVVPYAMRVTKDGFEQSWSHLNSGLWHTGEVRTDVRLYGIQRIAAGQAVELLVRPDDPRCGFDFIDTWRCRQVRVVSQVRGRLSLTAVVTQDEAVKGQSVTLTLTLPSGGGSANREIVVPVEAATEVAVQVNVFGDMAAQRITLQTSLSK